MVGRIDDFIGSGRKIGAGAHLLNHIAAHEDGAVGDFAALVVHGDDYARILD
jgi:hypothetical protein